VSALRRQGFVPGRHVLDAVGNGGFRFADMSHRGSILILPSGISAWHVTEWTSVTAHSLVLLFAEASEIDFVLIGAGDMPRAMPENLRWRFKELKLHCDVMTTVAAARTYNVLAGEGRRVASALIAI
jgi:uncharacterized protein